MRRRHTDQREAFFATNPEDILLVMKNGDVVLLDASLRGQCAAEANLFPLVVNGVEKFTADNYRDLARALRSLLPSIPVPIAANGI